MRKAFAIDRVKSGPEWRSTSPERMYLSWSRGRKGPAERRESNLRLRSTSWLPSQKQARIASTHRVVARTNRILPAMVRAVAPKGAERAGKSIRA